MADAFHNRGVRLNAIDAEFVFQRSGGLYLYCAIHRTFHSKDDFSSGNRGMQRTAVRYCLHTSAAERENFDNIANMTPTLEGRRRGAELLGLTLHPDDRAPEEAATSSRDARASARSSDAGAQAAPVAATGSSGSAAASAGSSGSAARRPRPSKPRTRSASSRASSRALPAESNHRRIKRVWGNSAGVIKTKIQQIYVDRHGRVVRRQRTGWTSGGAVDIKPCRSVAATVAILAELKAVNVLREAKPHKLHMSWGLVPFHSDAYELVRPGALICGQAAMVAFTATPLAVLGVDRWHVSRVPHENLLAYAGMNEQLEQSSGTGRAFLVRKPLGLIEDGRDIFGQARGIFVSIAFHIPGDESIDAPMPYGREAMGSRCAACPPAPLPDPLARASIAHLLHQLRRVTAKAMVDRIWP